MLMQNYLISDGNLQRPYKSVNQCFYYKSPPFLWFDSFILREHSINKLYFTKIIVKDVFLILVNPSSEIQE